VFLPAGTTPAVLLGQRTLAGETIIARLGDGAERDGLGQ
jgi:phosphatidylserine decarboxylase